MFLYFKSAYHCCQIILTILTSILIKIEKPTLNKAIKSANSIWEDIFHSLVHKHSCTSVAGKEVLSIISPPVFSDVVKKGSSYTVIKPRKENS